GLSSGQLRPQHAQRRLPLWSPRRPQGARDRLPRHHGRSHGAHVRHALVGRRHLAHAHHRPDEPRAQLRRLGLPRPATALHPSPPVARPHPPPPWTRSPPSPHWPATAPPPTTPT